MLNSILFAIGTNIPSKGSTKGKNNAVLKQNYDDLFELISSGSEKITTQLTKMQVNLVKNLVLCHLRSEDLEIIQRASQFLSILLSLPATKENFSVESALDLIKEPVLL